MNDEIVRFLVATDNHLGYCERDPVRCNDSFAAFEEVLRTAKAKEVDFVLLAGDMFHENKPTRRSLHSTMELLRKYCIGPNPVYIEVLNEQAEIFKASMGTVNYEDPYQSISMPVFAIHGNHDDPSREGGTGSALAALDLLAVANLINYFGKADSVEDIEITPILIRKGNTKIALYGLGAVRDERLNRMWNQKKVKFVRLAEENGRDEFFNIFILHQNRDYGRGRKNCVHESMIPEWMDLVVWGNEHECLPQLTESLVGTYRILQPGSSVATSLSRSESSSAPKHMACFEVKERKFRMKSIPFKQIRPFVYQEINLMDHRNLDANNPRIEEMIKDLLTTKVKEMIVEARGLIASEDTSTTTANANENVNAMETADAISPTTTSNSAAKYKIMDAKKVLIRLKVDFEGFPGINHQRFGAQFVGEVANPSEVLLIARKKRDNLRVTNDPNLTNAIQGELRHLLDSNGGGAGGGGGDDDAINKIKIEDLVNSTLQHSKNSLALLLENDMSEALDDYVAKKIPNAIQDLVTDSLKRIQQAFYQDTQIVDRATLLKATDKVRASVEKSKGKEKKSSAAILGLDDTRPQGGDDDQMEVEEDMPPPKTTARGGAAGRGGRGAGRGGRATAASKAATTTGGRGRGGRGGKAAKAVVEEEEEDDDLEYAIGLSTTASALAVVVDDMLEDSDDDFDVKSSRRGAASKTVAAVKPTAAPVVTKSSSSTTGRRSSRAVAKKPTSYVDSDIEELSEGDDDDGDYATKTKGKTSATAASKGKKKNDYDDDDDAFGNSDEDVENEEEDDDVVDLQDSSEEEETTSRKKQPAKKAPATKRQPAATPTSTAKGRKAAEPKPAATGRGGGRQKKTTAAAVSLVDDDDDEDASVVSRNTTATKNTISSNFLATPAPMRSAFLQQESQPPSLIFGSQASSAAATGAKRQRQLPLSFSQSTTGTKSRSAPKQATEWDD